MILKNRHRHTPKILEFLQFYHDNTSGNRIAIMIHMTIDANFCLPSSPTLSATLVTWTIFFIFNICPCFPMAHRHCWIVTPIWNHSKYGFYRWIICRYSILQPYYAYKIINFKFCFLSMNTWINNKDWALQIVESSCIRDHWESLENVTDSFMFFYK